MFSIIGLVGVKGSGKTTVARHLVQSGYTEVSFADTLKDSLCTLLGIDRCRFDDPAMKEQECSDLEDITMSPRAMMQKYGDMMKRLFGPHVFIKSVCRRLRLVETPVVISDIRFPDEAEFVRTLGAVIYRIVPGKTCHIQKGDHNGNEFGIVHMGTHDSESLQRSIVCDATIFNSGMGLEELYVAIDGYIVSANHTIIQSETRL